jgi:hypothetical protein
VAATLRLTARVLGQQIGFGGHQVVGGDTHGWFTANLRLRSARTQLANVQTIVAADRHHLRGRMVVRAMWSSVSVFWL